MAGESVEELLNPSLRVSRPVAACAKCRSAKIKCDGKLPACSACERSGRARECSSANDEFARGKERSYVAALETTIEKLQKRLNEVKGSSSASRRSSVMAITDTRPPFHQRPISSSSRKEAYNVDELVSDFGFLTVNATSRDFHGFTSTMSFARLLMGMSLVQEIPTLPESSLPSRYSITHLINNYFENIYVMLPFFSETEFMSSLSRVYHDTTYASPASHMDIWSVRLVLAISSASGCQVKGDTRYETTMQHISAAIKYAEYVLHPGSISGIQALMFLVQYALVDPEHFDCWYLIGMASRLVVDLGLHCEPAAEVRMSKHALDLRRRIFYCTFALDRLISMSLGYAFSFTDDSAPNVLLPTLATDLEKRSPSQLFLRSVRPSLFLFDIRRVQSSFYQRTRSSSRTEWSQVMATDYISSTLNDIQAWHSTLPSSFSQSILQAFYLEFLYSQVLAASPSQVVPMTNMTDATKSLLFNYAIQHAEQMQLVVQTSDAHPLLSYADLCRSRDVARQFQKLMWTHFDLMIKHRPDENATPLTNCNRAISFLGNTSQILDFARQRWGKTELRERFEQESAVLLARLKNKQQELNVAHFPSDPSLTQQVQQFPIQMHSTLHSDFSQNLWPQVEQFDSTQFQSSMSEYESSYFNADVGPAMHRSNLARQTSWTEQGQPASLNLPQGSLPRRSYEFLGRQG